MKHSQVSLRNLGIKGIVSRDEYLLDGPKKSNLYFFTERLWFSQFFVVYL